MTQDARRTELLGWIAATQRTRRRLSIALVVAGALSIGLLFWRTSFGVFGIAVTALVGLTGFWITAGHIADWRARLAALDRPPIVAGGGRRF